MKIIVIGGTGTLGQAVVKELSSRHEVIAVGHQTSEYNVDITKPESIENLFQSIGKFDALIATTGSVKFSPLQDLSEQDYKIGLQSKLMGQVNLVILGLKHINPKGSFTLTSGILSHDPIAMGSSASMVNGAIDAFVKSAAIEMPHHVRINAVSPTVVTESLDKYQNFFRGFESVSANRVALAYSKSVEGAQTGQVYHVN
jgi:NAD(P)-dependent dehydrogenase (short-subunit alcohol dehydrogenase family)